MNWPLAFLLGAVVGFAAGALFMDAYRTVRPRHEQQEAPMEPNPAPQQETDAHRVQRRRDLLLQVVLAFTAIALVGIGILTIVTRADQQNAQQNRQDYNDCFDRSQQDYQAAANPRSAASSTAQDKLYLFLQAAAPVLQPDTTPAQIARFRQTLADYLASYQTFQQVRKDHPLPPLPEQVCGEAP